MKNKILTNSILSGLMLCFIMLIACKNTNTKSPTSAQPENESALTDVAKALLNKIPEATPVTEEENGIGLHIKYVSRVDDYYMVNWSFKMESMTDNSQNEMFVWTKLYFIDPENYENNYQNFTVKDGELKFSYKSGEEMGRPPRSMQFEPPSKVVYLYFEGIDKENSSESESYTVPLFFTIVLGDKPFVLEETPRRANHLFDHIIKTNK